MSERAIALRARVAETEADGLDGFRGALARAGAGAREQVMVDFLEDDLRAAEGALQRLRSYVGAIDGALHAARARRGELLGLAHREQPVESLDELQATIAGLRRRLAIVALRLPA